MTEYEFKLRFFDLIEEVRDLLLEGWKLDDVLLEVREANSLTSKQIKEIEDFLFK